jgi:uncharacterized membrane protein
LSRLDEITGPVDIVLIRFPGNNFTGEIAPALAEVVEAGIVRILDLVFVLKDADGNVTGIEFSDIGEGAAAYDELDGEVGELLTDEDIESAGEALDDDSSALMILFENTWASRLATALRNADGEVVAFERIPRENLEASLAEIDA